MKNSIEFKIFKKITNSPSASIVCISVIISLISWQYTKGFYQAIRVPIPFSYIETLIFFFERIALFTFNNKVDPLPIELKLSNILVIGCLCVSLILFYIFLPLLVKLVKKTNWRRWIPVVWLFIFTLLVGIGFMDYRNPLFALIMISIIPIHIFTGGLHYSSNAPWLWRVSIFTFILMILALIGSAGYEDGLKHFKSKRTEICLSKSLLVSEGKEVCGKLLMSTNSEICITRLDNHISSCVSRDKWDYSIKITE